MSDQKPLNFERAFREELETLRDFSINKEDTINAAHRARLSGLAFSGGGIRSATFNLGVLQALARLGILNKFDYLSTVSGGGYIGGWLTAWIRRKCRSIQENSKKQASENDPPPSDEERRKQPDRDKFEIGSLINEFIYRTKTYTINSWTRFLGDRSQNGSKLCHDDHSAEQAEIAFQSVLNNLKTPRSNKRPHEARPIFHLREFSNYLTPRRGFWSNDAWTLGVAYIRNFVLTFSVLLGALIAGVLFIHNAAVIYYHILTPGKVNYQWGSFAAFVFFLSAAAFFCAWDLATCKALSDRKRMEIKCSITISRLAIWAAIISIWFGAAGLWYVRGHFSQNWLDALLNLTTLKITGLTTFSVVLGGILGKLVAIRRLKLVSEMWDINIKRIIAILVGSIGLVLSISLCAMVIGKWPAEPQKMGAGPWLMVVWGPLLGLLAYGIFAAIFVGTSRKSIDELEREWLARIFAPITKWTGLLCILTALVLYTPVVNNWLKFQGYSILGALWAVISITGVQLSRYGGKIASTKALRWISRAVLAVSPVVFMAGMMVIIILGFNHWGGDFFNDPGDQIGIWSVVPRVEIKKIAICAIVASGVLLFTIFWSCLVGVNTFSLHALYGNRLIRAFLGASNLKRQEHPFTGFDPNDNEVLLAELNPRSSDYHGPYLIINAAINLVHDDRLAWQQRKAGSFTFTPKFCGYEFPSAAVNNGKSQNNARGGYVPSHLYTDGGEGGNGISLGKAMTISGAAASPNMGYHSSPALAFLMTVFNVRLGWWLPNTSVNIKKPKSFRKRGPLWGLGYLLFELFGMTNSKRAFVYVSDGGHFENLGIYELVRRRTRFILASDAAADPEMAFDDLGNAVERCRTDFGISIDIDVNQLKVDAETRLSGWHCATGKIRYSDVDADAKDGILVYIKASLTGDETQDIQAYAARNSDFPHETTADQWFDESQFESYRALGQHIAEHVLQIPVRVTDERKAERAVLQSKTSLKTNQAYNKDMEHLFNELYKMWYPPMDEEQTSKVDLDAKLEDILDEMRNDRKLSFLDLQLYPDVTRSIQGTKIKSSSASWVPRDYSELRAGFCFCKRLLQFMQEVYFKRDLDITSDAPSSRGWMNLLRRWSFSRMLRYTWSVTAGTYSARFQTFCEHHLGLDVGYLRWEAPIGVQYFAEEPIKDPMSGLDFYERLLIKEFLRQHLKNNPKLSEDTPFKIYPLVLGTENPILEDYNARALINAGFAICGPSGKANDAQDVILYLRIRPTMRAMGLFNQALECLPYGDDGKPLRFSLPDQHFKIQDIGLKERDGWRRRIYREIYSLLMSNENYDWLDRPKPDMTDMKPTSELSSQPNAQEKLTV